MMDKVERVEWQHDFSSAYLRTYKKASELSKKNIRCFPECSYAGHSNSGFCGRPICCKAHFSSPVPDGQTIQAFGRFCESNAEQEFVPGSSTRLEKLKDDERTKSTPLKPYISGRVTSAISSSCFELVFNELLLGYHYQWLSSKTTGNTKHSFRVYFFVAKDSLSDTLTCIGSSSSPPFSLYTRHRFQGKKPEEVRSDGSRSPSAAAGEDIQSPRSSGSAASGPLGIGGSTVGVGVSGKALGWGERPSRESSVDTDAVDHSGSARDSFSHFSFHRNDRQDFSGPESMNTFREIRTGLSSSSYHDEVSPKEKRRLREVYTASEGPRGSYAHFREDSFKYQRAIPENRTLDRLVRFVFRFGSKPDPAILDPRDLSGPEEELNRDLDLVLDLIAERSDWSEVETEIFGKSSGDNFDLFGAIAEEGVDESGLHRGAIRLNGSGEDDDISGSNALHPNHDQDRIRESGGGLVEALRVDVSKQSIQDPFSTGCLPKCNYADNYGLDTLKSVILKFHEPVEEREELAASVLAGMRSIADFVMTQMLISETTDFFSNMVKRWSMNDGLEELRKIIEAERNLHFEWNQKHEDESYDLVNMSMLNELSVYAAVRHGFRILMSRCLLATGHSVQDFEIAMELAAKHGVLLLDPFYPPSKMAARYLHLQLYGHTRGMQTQDYGSSKQVFSDSLQQRIYAKDLLIARRLIFRNIMLDRIRGERQLKKLIARYPKPPIPPQYDMKGTWERIKLYKREGTLLGMQEAIGSFASEVPFGSFFAELFESLWSKLTIYIDSAVFTCQGRQVLLAHPKTIVRLGAEPEKTEQPMPLPVDSIAAVGTKRDLAGWLHMNEKGQCGVMTVIGTIAVQESTGSLLRTARERLRTNANFDSSEQRRVTEWLATIDSRDEDEHTTSELRFHHFYHRQGENLHLNGVVRLYIRRSEAPPLLDASAATTTDPRCYKLIDETGVYKLVSRDCT